ncbi:MAG: Response regulator PleD [Candidatus Dichloromethanomonas elyunquensis]|nr:MAG: Response regulator PleD [Candidatus Dichloromethanomonas elyunquensis]
MGLLTMGEKWILQTIICFSFINFVLVFFLNKEKTFSKMFGLSFLLPFILGLICIFNSDLAVDRVLLQYVNLIYLIMLCLLTLLWSGKKYLISLVMPVFFPLMALFFLTKMELPAFFLSPYLGGGATVCLLGIDIFFLKKTIVKKEKELFWGVCLLGTCETLFILYPGSALYLTAVGFLAAYLLLFIYVFKKSMEPYLVRIKKAEAKLSDVNKTISVEVKKRMLEMEKHNEHLLNMVQRDPLVDAYNKKGITNFIQELVYDPGRDPFTIIIFDIDNFKTINDTQGHVAGDMVLKKVAGIAKQNIRGFDMLGRYGGDEFLIILPGTKVSDALFVAERFRKKVCAESGISVSIGVAAFPDDATTLTKLIEAADAGLYESKRIGKNAVSYCPREKTR